MAKYSSVPIYMSNRLTTIGAVWYGFSYFFFIAGYIKLTKMVAIIWPDILVLVLYFLIIIGVGIVSALKAKTSDVKGYFLAGRNSIWFVVGCSIFSTNIGSPGFVGSAGSAAVGGIAVTVYGWHAMFMLILLGWVFLPVYRACGCVTMPEYLKYRFGGQRIRVFYSLMHTLNTNFAKLPVQMYSGAIFVNTVFGWNIYYSVLLILACTAVFTILGGQSAVMYTDTIQTFIIIAGSALLSTVCILEIGSWSEIKRRYMESVTNYTLVDYSLYGNHTCGLPREDSFNMLRSVNADLPWTGLAFGLTVIAIFYWCNDQIVVQRCLCAKNVSHAKGGVLIAAYAKILIFFLYIIPGLVSRIVFTDQVACADPEKCQEICGNPAGCSNMAYPLLVVHLLPQGARGLMLAAILAAQMSCLTSFFNSSGAIFTLDIWRSIRKKAKESELMVVSRVYICVQVVICLVWMPIMQEVQGSQLLEYVQAIYSYLVPPIVSTFLMGIFWKGTTEIGAFVGLVIGSLIGITRMVLSLMRSAPYCGSGEQDERFPIIARVHFLHFAAILTVIVALIQFSVSLFTKKRTPQQLKGVTFWTRHEPRLIPEMEEAETGTEITSETADNGLDNEDIPVKISLGKRLLRFICGVGPQTTATLSPEAKKILHLQMTNIEEKPFWRQFLNANAIICGAVAVFIHAYFA